MAKHVPSCLVSCALIVAAILVAGAAQAQQLENAAVRGALGEVSSHYITPTGLSLNVMNNDFLGNTDKYMSGSTDLSLLRTWGAGGEVSSSVEFALSWRALTPAWSQTVGGISLPAALGRYADWMEGEIAYARSYAMPYGRFKMQLSLGLGHIGEKGMKALHTAVHRGIGMQTSGLDYTDQPEGLTHKADLFIARIQDGSMVGFGMNTDKDMREVYVQGNLVRDFGDGYELGVEARVARQLGSELYDGIRPVRGEISASVLIAKYYQPSIKYVSSFLKDDPRGQLYAELLKLNVPF